MLFLAFFVLSCKKGEEKKEPVACFNPTNMFVEFGKTVNFSNCSSEYDRLYWNFGDGSSSTDKEPAHKFEKYGDFNVSLTAHNGSKFNQVYSRMIVGLKMNLPFSAEITPSADTSKYLKIFSYETSIHKTTNLNDSTDLMYYDKPDSQTLPLLLNRTFRVGENTSFKIKLRIYASTKKSGGWPMPIDSILTEEIEPFTAAKKSITIIHPIVKVSYSISEGYASH